jgi:hypothetical protein
MPKPIAKVANLPRGRAGYCDPWALVEGQTPYVPPPLDPEPNARNPPPPDPHSGAFYLWANADVFDAPIVEGHDAAGSPIVATLPVVRDENGGLVVAFGPTDKLSHPPRLENASAISTNGFFQCRVENLQAALDTGPPVSAASEKARLEAEAAKGKKTAAT